MEGEDADVVQSPDQISVISAPVAKPEETKVEPSVEETPKIEPEIKQEPLPTLGYCFSLYDYDAEASDELNLEEGQVSIRYFVLNIFKENVNAKTYLLLYRLYESFHEMLMV